MIYLVQIGQQLSIVMIQRIIVCVLVLIVVIPLLDAQPRDMGLSIAVGLGYIEVGYVTTRGAWVCQSPYVWDIFR